jgi:two-component system sensor histidine kinase KdpD
VSGHQLESLADRMERVGDGSRLETALVLARRPAVVLIDDLAEPSTRDGGPPRWAEAERLVAAGIDVVATANVAAVESLADEVGRLTGVRSRHTVPDRVLQSADQLELVDITPQALRRRLAHGGLCAPEDLDAARSAWYRPRVLGALRELALGWVAGTVPAQHAAWAGSLGEPESRSTVPGTGERLMVALSGGPESEHVLHRATRLANRLRQSDLVLVHILAAPDPGTRAADSGRLRDLAESAGVQLQQVVGDDVAAALLDLAHAEGVTQIVLGTSASRARGGRRRLRAAGPGVAERVMAGAADGVDVHLVGGGPAHGRAVEMPTTRAGLSGRRRSVGFALTVLLPALLTWVLLAAGTHVGLPGDTLVLLLGVVVTSLVGGLWPAVLAAVVGSTMLNFFFIPPVRTFRVADPHNVITLVLFVVVAVLVSAVVHRAAATAAEAARASAESRTLSAIAGSALHGDDALPALLDQLRSSFGMRSAALLSDSGTGWTVVHARGAEPPTDPADADVQVTAGSGLVLALSGRTLAAADRRVLQAFAARAQGLLERDTLARSAAVAERLEATERLRDALLAAVGHDLRTPLASATAAVSSLRSQDVAWSRAERDELLATAEESLTRLARLVSDLLDLSRLRAGVLAVDREPVWIDEILPPALDEVGEAGRRVGIRLPEDLPAAQADPALLTRVLVNVIGNALRYAPTEVPPVVSGSAAGDRVEVRVVDTGPGIPSEDTERVFVPFQRLGDTDNRAGLGLGLALSRGLVEAMGGTLAPEETPGGGLTMVLSLPAAPAAGAAPLPEPGHRERQEHA